MIKMLCDQCGKEVERYQSYWTMTWSNGGVPDRHIHTTCLGNYHLAMAAMTKAGKAIQ